MKPAILAAGTVIWRKRNGQTEVVLVHRPRYDDWSLPKGKLDSGEELIACAYRETLEETGFDTHFGPFIGSVEYFTPEGLKQVSYWAAQLRDPASIFIANSEVDEILWLPIEDAIAKVTQDTDGEILTKFIDIPYDSTPLIFLRHAKALAREEWQGGDEDRPLDHFGQLQAARMHSIYQVFGIHEIHTSDAVRCYDTIDQMTRILKVDPIITSQISEYTYKKNKEKSLDYAKLLRDSVLDLRLPILACSHNPVLPKMLEKILKKSKAAPVVTKLMPGDAWVVHMGKKKALQVDFIAAPLTASTNP